MKTKMTVNYASGRVEQFEVDIFGSGGSELRLKDFAENPTIVMKTDSELIIIPAQAIESISLALPGPVGEQLPLKDIRHARRLK